MGSNTFQPLHLILTRRHKFSGKTHHDWKHPVASLAPVQGSFKRPIQTTTRAQLSWSDWVSRWTLSVLGSVQKPLSDLLLQSYNHVSKHYACTFYQPQRTACFISLWKKLSIAAKPSNLSGSFELSLCLCPLLLWFASSTRVLSAPPCKEGRRRMGSMAGYIGTSQSCQQTTRMEKYTIRQCHESCMSQGRGNTRAAEYTSIISGLIWHCCVNRAIKPIEPPAKAEGPLPSQEDGGLCFYPSYDKKHFHWALISTLNYSLLSPTKSPNCAVRPSGNSSWVWNSGVLLRKVKLLNFQSLCAVGYH